MDKTRAEEIASSPIMANVTYNGNRIYIESINGNKGTAAVHLLNQPENSQEVPLNNLMEH